MRWRATGLLVIGVTVGLWSVPASAQEVSFTVGRFLGDDILQPVRPELPSISLSDAAIFGARFNFPLALIELEATLLTGKSSVFANTPAVTDVRLSYAEAGALLKLLPGPVAPYLAAGLGFHRLSFDVPGGASSTDIGYMLGVGLKLGLGGFGARVDLRDHITRLDPATVDPDVADLLGLDTGVTLHNFELSAGLVVRF